MKTITVTNVGPITSAELPYLEEGGIVVLRGAQGVGKSTILDALNVAAGNKGSVGLKDRAASGSVEAFGVTLKIGRNVRRQGEPEVVSLESRFSVGDLIDPGIQDPAAADAKRIKALVQLSGTAADPKLFYPLFKGGLDEFASIVDASVPRMTDLVGMADKIKRDCESAARKCANEAEHAEGRVVAGRQAIEGINFDCPSDQEILQATLEDAIRDQSKLYERADASRQAAGRAEEAKIKLAEAKAKETITLEVAEKNVAGATADVQAAETAVKELTALLEAARKALWDSQIWLRNMNLQLDQIKSRADLVAGWQKAINEAGADQIDPAALDQADARVSEARRGVEQGAVVRHGLQRKAEIDEALETGKTKRARSDRLRDMAKGTDDVLSAIVAKLGTPLRVEGGRLCLDTSRRGITYFAELSDGERAQVGL